LEQLFCGQREAQTGRKARRRGLILEEALEGEVDDFSGRGHYARGVQAGYRNGYPAPQIRYRCSRIKYGCPQPRETLTPFRSQIR
jgi:hypothetical protein